MFDEKILGDLSIDPYVAIKTLCDIFTEIHHSYPDGAREEYYDSYIEAFAAMEAFINATGLPFLIPRLLNEHSRDENITAIVMFFYGLRNEISKREHDLVLSKARDKYGKLFGTTFIYQFSDGDVTRIQQLVNELRDEINKSELFDAKHKQRVLMKLESLQKELGKKMSSLDKLWGLIGEAGVALGKFGQDAKPLVDRIREIAQITWRTQARAEELPSGTSLPLLTDNIKDKNN